VIDLLELSHEPDRPALLFEDGSTLTRGDLHRRAARVAATLAATRKALVWLPGDRELGTVLGYLGARQAGHTTAFLPCPATSSAVGALLHAYQPEFVVAPGPHAAHLAAHGYRPMPDGADCPLWQRKTGDPADEIDAELAVMLGTSGSTGSAKAVKLTGRAVLDSTVAITAALGIDGDQRAVTSLPICFSYGLSVLNTHLRARAAVLLSTSRPASLPLWHAMIRHGVTSFAGVPATYQSLGPTHRRLLSGSRLAAMTQSGGRLPDDVLLRWWSAITEHGGAFHAMYGQTESTARITCLDPAELPDRVGSVGTAVPGGEVWIEPADGHRGARPGEGEVCFRGPGVMAGYARGRADLVPGPPPEPVLRTGDLGYLDDGFLYITGRIKRIAKLLGYRVSLDEVEQMFAGLDGESAVIAPDDRIVVCVVTHSTPDGRFEAERRRVVAMLGVPDPYVRLAAVPSLPRTPNGKPDYRALAAVLADAGAVRAGR
jgi:acyl-CoA synthetase (AMP-forming)/AMP-acid ligase II